MPPVVPTPSHSVGVFVYLVTEWTTTMGAILLQFEPDSSRVTRGIAPVSNTMAVVDLAGPRAAVFSITEVAHLVDRPLTLAIAYFRALL